MTKQTQERMREQGRRDRAAGLSVDAFQLLGLGETAREFYEIGWRESGPVTRAEHARKFCEHGNRIGDFCMGCEQQRMG